MGKRKTGYGYVLPLAFVLLFILALISSSIVSARESGCYCKNKYYGTIHGGVYFDFCYHYPGTQYTDENGKTYLYATKVFEDVPSGIKLARVYTGIWGGSPGCGDGFNITINDYISANYNACDPCPKGPCDDFEGVHGDGTRCNVLNWSYNSNPPSTTGVCRVYTTGCGVNFITYEATPSISPGANTITVRERDSPISCYGHGWGPGYGIYGIGLQAVYENESMPDMTYFINEGTATIIESSGCCDDSDEIIIYFNGSVYTGSATEVKFWTMGFPHPVESVNPELNGHDLGTETYKAPDGSWYKWESIPPSYLDQSSNLIYYYRPYTGSATYERAHLATLTIEYERSDLTVTNISAQTLYANYVNAVNATVYNAVGNVFSAGFNVTLYADGTKVGVQQVSNMSAGESKEVSFSWKPTSEGAYELNVTADVEDIVLETNETNNSKTKAVDVKPPPVPIWRYQSSNVSSITTGGTTELGAQGRAKQGLDYAVLRTNETEDWKNCTDYGSPMEMFSLHSDSFTHTSDADWTAQTLENLEVAAGDVKLLWTEAGGSNIALGKNSYASDYDSEACSGSGDGNDGDAYTYWYAPVPEDYTYDWWYVDLGEITKVGKIIIRDVSYLGTNGHYDIQISDDASNWTTEIANVNTGGTVTFYDLDWSCRYVRFHVYHSDGAGFAEFEAYNPTGYKSSGLLTTTATSTGNPIVSVTPMWNSTESAGTSLSVNVSMDEGATWTPANKGEELTWDYDTLNTNLKYRVLFETSDISETPVLHDITLNYKTKDAPKDMWMWSNFTWQNASVTAGTTVGWKICYNDTFGKTTCTDVLTFDTFAADTTPPYTAGHDPAKGATGVPRNTNITLHVKDDGEGVDNSTIVMKVAGSQVTPVISGSPTDYTLTYDPSTVFNFWQVVNVAVNASDLASSPNDMTDEYSFTTIGDKPDLIVTGINAYHYNTAAEPWFNLSNEVDVVVENAGGAASGPSNVSLYANGRLIGKQSVPGLDVGSSTTVQFKWIPIGEDCFRDCSFAYSHKDFNLIAIADCDSDVDELNETNNNLTTVERACYNGYMTDEQLENVAHGTLHGGLIFTTGDGTYGGLYDPGDSIDTTYEITIPENASVKLARLNVYYTWQYATSCPEMEVSITNETGTYVVPLDKRYNDIKCQCPGAPWVFPWGNYVFNITDHIQGSGIYTVTVKRAVFPPNPSFCIAAPGIEVLYEDETKPLIEYWIAEGADVLMGGRRGDGGHLSLEECINNATFEVEGGKGINLSKVRNATLGVVSLWAGSAWQPGQTNYLFFNGIELGRGVYHGYSDTYSETTGGISMHIGSTNAQVGVNVTDVTSYLNASINRVGQGDDGDNMMPCNAFLVVEYGEELPPSGICGDVNNDGFVTTTDAVIVYKHYFYPEEYPLANEWAADVNCDGYITTTDAEIIYKHYFYPEEYSLECCS